ncbi:hypothetical protein scyTo_0013729 [Scyliorhinus torazame]|uniref:Uncharacterized protein n=1 Tax=Scyliorhinus torazame TaxID=75743 RepID=A0A401P3H4_SCYTO|nr:hypothetical protein [Scyliorhinus torazame]
MPFGRKCQKKLNQERVRAQVPKQRKAKRESGTERSPKKTVKSRNKNGNLKQVLLREIESKDQKKRL